MDQAALDAAIEKLSAARDPWVKKPMAERIALLEGCLAGVVRTAERWVAEACAIKGIDAGAPVAGEEWLGGPNATARYLRLLVQALRAGGAPRPPVMQKKGEQLVARVFPNDVHDRAMLAGFTADVWMAPGARATQGAFYRSPPEKGRTCLVLGGGNVTSIAPMDVLYKLFVDGEVVLLKVHPVLERVGPVLEEALAPLVAAGVLAFAYGGGDVGSYLADHAGIDTLHVTGSDRTYDAIVWGSDEAERKRRKGDKTPKNARPFTAELGCVTPVLVVPGPWSAADMKYQAAHVAGMLSNNASFNCNAAKVLVVARDWLQRETFLEEVRAALAALPPRRAYYPGSEERYARFCTRYADAEALGPKGDGVVPWTLLPKVAPDGSELALSEEAFCGVLGVVTLDAKDAPTFLAAAVPFANDSVWGSLSTCLLVHPITADAHRAELDRAIMALRYGGIGINCWPGVIYGLASPTWGAFPGNPPEDIRSGSGVVHNAFLFDHAEKSVVTGPFRMRPKPPWFPHHRTLLPLARLLLQAEARPSLASLAKIAWTAMRA